jgi:nucleoside-diphosphate-sugar epimerase
MQGLHLAKETLLNVRPKKIMLSGPSGFLGSNVLRAILEVHQIRKSHGVDPGELILLSGSPGKLMQSLYKRIGPEKMGTVRASRVDYYKQHDVDTWTDQLGSLGVEGEDAVFINLAAVAGPVAGIPDAMMDVNYRAPLAAARAAEALGFGHWVQSSTQATNAERFGQVPYSRAKAMADYAFARAKSLPVSIACLGLLYSKDDGLIGQQRKNESLVNLIDLALLPLTPIMGDGMAPLQPQEVLDAAVRLAYLALTNPKDRPRQFRDPKTDRFARSICAFSEGFRYYDAVGPQTISIQGMLEKFAKAQGNKHFRPTHIGYRNMERVLNIKSLGNLNRQFVSLLRSEQDAKNPIIGDPTVWEGLLGPEARLITLDEAFAENMASIEKRKVRSFPYWSTVRWAFQNPKVIPPGIDLGVEILLSYFFGIRNNQ